MHIIIIVMCVCVCVCESEWERVYLEYWMECIPDFIPIPWQITHMYGKAFYDELRLIF